MSINSSKVDYFQQKNVSFTLVKKKELPFCCPPKDTAGWNMHPQVFLKFNDSNMASCPYCCADYKIDE